MGFTPKAPFNAKMVMIVDDDPSSALLLSRFLDHVGYRSVMVADGEAALEVIASGRDVPNLILTDMLMPGMGGSQLLARLQSAPTTKKIPVIILSGLERGEVAPERIGAQGYLKKPLHLDELSSLINLHLN